MMIDMPTRARPAPRPPAIAVGIAATALALTSTPDVSARPVAGLQVLYDFSSAEGAVVRDRSGAGEPVDLTIADPAAVRRSPGKLELHGETVIRSDPAAARRLTEALRRSGEFTVEAWVTPAVTDQSGPARIVTLSRDTGARNFTLGQEGDRFDVRFRTSRTDGNGLPSVQSPAGSLGTRLTHVVYTRFRTGDARTYLDGKRVARGNIPGDTGGWDAGYRLALGNELSGDRPWAGIFHRVAVYSRALRPSEVAAHFEAGLPVPGKAPAVAAAPAPAEATQPALTAADAPTLPRPGVLALYDFGAGGGGALVRDRSGAGEPVDLKIENPGAVRRRAGTLEVRGPTIIRSIKPATRIASAVRRSGAFSVEAWVTPANTDQAGPARIVTLSAGSSERNFTLGQVGDLYDVRFRTQRTSNNGIPSVSSPKKSLRPRLTHVVYTRGRGGDAVLYLDGNPRAKKAVPGAPNNWDGDFRLALANETSRDRPWLGAYHLVAIYGRELKPEEVRRNFSAGPAAASATGLAAGGTETPGERLFHAEIAPLLARHCFECHDASTRKGELDLTRKKTAFAGGETGPAIAPGDLAQSLLWESVEKDEMPRKRPPLSAREKGLLRRWIESGATWPVEAIDPAIYGGDQRAAQNWVRRLTVPEYIETVRGATGVDISAEAREILPPDQRADGFSNTAYNLSVDLAHVEAYARLAEIVVQRMDVAAFAGRFTRERRFDADKFRDTIDRVGRWLLRGPLDEREITSLAGVAASVASIGGSYDEVVGYTLEAMLQSPRFIYRIENQRGDGTPWPASDYELASRLSYLVWGAPPDRELMKAADDGDLYDTRLIEKQVRRMLDDPRAVERSARFITEWLDLDRLENLRPSEKKFPRWNRALSADMRGETLAFFREVVWEQKRPLADLLNAQVTFLTPALAEHYGLEPERGRPGAKDRWARYDLAGVPSRGGLLTQGSILTVGGDEASMVSRGLFVLHDLLRGKVKDPPPCVDTTPVPTKPGLTQRAIAEERIASPNCGGCHGKFEPLAFGLEKFDGLGTFHQRDEHGNPLREDGSILIPGSADPLPYQTSAELMNLLAASERVRWCITQKFAQFALGRPLVGTDVPALEKAHRQAQQAGGTYPALVNALATSELILLTRTEAAEE